MKAHLKVICITALATTSFWVLVVYLLFRLNGRAPDAPLAMVSIPGRTGPVAALVVERYETAFTGPHREVFHSEVPPGEIGNFVVRMVPSGVGK